MGKTQRLDKILSNQGYGTRSEVRKLIKSGAVSIDGSLADDPSMHVNPDTSKVEVSGEEMKYERFSYYIMNKPAGVISATYDPRHRTVIDLLPEKLRKMKLFPAGRLDIDTEGLLILTNDGDLAHRLLSPKKHVPKRYYALVEGLVDENDIKLFREGLLLEEGFKTMPAELYILKKGTCSEIELVIYEGKFHQVKRMFEKTGKKVKYLKRLSMGGLMLDKGLKPGEVRELRQEELDLLTK